MAVRIVERLGVAVSYIVDKQSAKFATDTYLNIAAGVTAAGVAISKWTIDQAAAIDETVKTARSLSMAASEYSELAFAADHAGVSQEHLNTGLRGLTMRIGAAANGSKEAQRDFSALGLEWERADGKLKTAGDLLPELADGLARMTDEGKRDAIQLRLLGESGAKLRTLLAGGSKGIEDMRKRAQALGISLDDATAASAERLTDAVTDLKALFSGFALQIAAEIMPRLADVIEDFVEWATVSDGIVQVGLERTTRLLAIALDYLDTPLGKTVAGIVALSGAIGIAKTGAGLLGSVGRLVPMLGAMTGGMGAGVAAAAPYALAIAGIALVLEDLYVASQGGESVTLSLAAAMGVEKETAEALAGMLELVTSALGPFISLSKEAALLTGEGIVKVFNNWVWAGKQVGGMLLWVINLFRDLQTAIANMLGFEQTPLDWLLGEAADLLPSVGSFSDAAQGFKNLGRFIAGDQNVQFNPDTAVGRSPIGFLANSARNRNMDDLREQIARSNELPENAPGASSSSVSINPTVNLRTGVDANQVADEAAEAVRREVHYGFATGFQL